MKKEIILTAAAFVSVAAVSEPADPASRRATPSSSSTARREA